MILNKKWFFGTDILTRNAVKSKLIYYGWGIAIDAAGARSCGNNFSGNVIVFCVISRSSIHSDNHKNSLLALGEGLADNINE